MAPARFSKVKWGDGLSVTDEGAGVIRVDAAGGGGGTGGIRFNTYPQQSDWLWIKTIGDSGPDPPGFGMWLMSETGINIQNTGGVAASAAGNLDIIQDSPTNDLNIYTSDPGSTINMVGGKGLIIEGHGDTGIILKATGAGDMLIRHDGSTGWIDITSYHGELRLAGYEAARLASDTGEVRLEGNTLAFASATQKATVTTLADVIALLQSYGLAL
jgi:hypothetical protein